MSENTTEPRMSEEVRKAADADFDRGWKAYFEGIMPVGTDNPDFREGWMSACSQAEDL